MRYAVVIEKADSNYSAYVPDLPGCIATGASIDEVEREIRDAIRFHLDGLKENGLPIPAPTRVYTHKLDSQLRRTPIHSPLSPLPRVGTHKPICVFGEA